MHLLALASLALFMSLDLIYSEALLKFSCDYITSFFFVKSLSWHQTPFPLCRRTRAAASQGVRVPERGTAPGKRLVG